MGTTLLRQCVIVSFARLYECAKHSSIGKRKKRVSSKLGWKFRRKHLWLRWHAEPSCLKIPAFWLIRPRPTACQSQPRLIILVYVNHVASHKNNSLISRGRFYHRYSISTSKCRTQVGKLRYAVYNPRAKHSPFLCSSESVQSENVVVKKNRKLMVCVYKRYI